MCVGQRAQPVIRRHHVAVAIAPAHLALAVNRLAREQARAMEVQPRRQRIAGERVDLGGERPRNMGVSQTLANHRAVLALDQRVVIAAPRPRPGHRADVQPVQQFHHRMIDELRAVVAVEVDDPERECTEQILQHRNQEALGNRLGRTDELHLTSSIMLISYTPLTPPRSP